MQSTNDTASPYLAAPKEVINKRLPLSSGVAKGTPLPCFFIFSICTCSHLPLPHSTSASPVSTRLARKQATDVQSESPLPSANRQSAVSDLLLSAAAVMFSSTGVVRG